jgi:hypothetical protein
VRLLQVLCDESRGQNDEEDDDLNPAAKI